MDSDEQFKISCKGTSKNRFGYKGGGGNFSEGYGNTGLCLSGLHLAEAVVTHCLRSTVLVGQFQFKISQVDSNADIK